MLDIPPLLFFQSKNPFSGSQKNLRFLIKPEENLIVYIWKGPYCFEKSEILETKEFPLESKGREAMLAWLEEKGKELNEE